MIFLLKIYFILEKTLLVLSIKKFFFLRIIENNKFWVIYDRILKTKK
jgi:hypothetical protein